MLDRDAILGALRRLAALLHERGVQGEVCVLGGTAMVLGFRSRVSTKDVDAPEDRIPPRAVYLLEDLFQRKGRPS